MTEMHQHDYATSYPTCVKTHSTLRIFSDDFAPIDITERLQIEPTCAFQKGDFYVNGKLQRKTNGWFYSTEKMCASKDTRRHIDVILALLDGKLDSFMEFHLKGCKADITSYWVTTGQGGPWLMPEQMLQLGSLGIAVWWDIYFATENEI